MLEAPPQLGTIPAAARPGFVKLDEPGLERAHADAEDIVALTAQDAPAALAGMGCRSEGRSA